MVLVKVAGALRSRRLPLGQAQDAAREGVTGYETCGCPQRAPRAASSEHAPTRSRWGTRKTVRRSDRAPRRTAARAQDCSSRLLGRAGRRRWPTRRRRPAL